MIQSKPILNPFTTHRLATYIFTTLGRADAMGLLPLNEPIKTMDLPSMRQVLGHIQKAGIGKAIQFTDQDNGAELENAFERLNLALEESPAPEFEWERLSGILGIDLLSRLLGTAVASIRRYRSATRTTPDDVAGRLHLLSLTVGDLSGGYNEAGIRQWFDRKRVQLGGKSPAELLGKTWAADDENARKVRELARSLTAAAAT